MTRTGAMGTPATSRLATSGTTPQEQNGDKAPNSDAMTMAVAGRAEKAEATRLSAPAAFRPAAIATDARIKGRMLMKASMVNSVLAAACCSVVTARRARMATRPQTGAPASAARWRRRDARVTGGGPPVQRLVDAGETESAR